MTLKEIFERLKPTLLYEGESMDSWVNSTIQDMVELVLNYLNANVLDDTVYTDLPLSLYWIVKNLVMFQFNRQRSEGLTSHTEGGETMRWADNGADPLEPYIEELNNFIDGISRKSSFDFY